MSSTVHHAKVRLPQRLTTWPRFYRFYTFVVVVQGVHVIEHVVQLIQVYRYHIPSERAFGLLGYVFNFTGTAEWMHWVFNALYLASIYVLVFGVQELALGGLLPRWTFRTFFIGAVGLESWHMTEHFVIMYHVIRNSGCPCPGIGDAVLKVSDIQLHFVYNAITYICVVIPFVYLWNARRRGSSPTTGQR
jgi:hypothetical protein